jgi:hypothetical protein
MRKLAAEFLGTFLLFLAVGNAVFGLDRIGAVGVALAFGLVLLALAYAIGPISGCHVNPAVTLGVLLTRRVALGEAAAYWVVQILGAIAGAALITGLTWFGKGQGPGGRPGPQLVGCHGLRQRRVRHRGRTYVPIRVRHPAGHQPPGTSLTGNSLLHFAFHQPVGATGAANAPVGAGPARECVGPGPATEGVVAGPAIEGVVTGPAIEGVVTGPAKEGVVASPAAERVVPSESIDDVVPCAGVDSIGSWCASDAVVADSTEFGDRVT